MTADFPLSGAPSRRLARFCRSKCLADTSCMAYEFEANGKDFGDCSLFSSPGPIVHTGNTRMAAGVCWFSQDDTQAVDDDPKKPVEQMGWNVEENVEESHESATFYMIGDR